METGEQSPALPTVEEKEFRLMKIGWSKEDTRTEQEKGEGMPRLNNEGLLSVDLDVNALVELLKAEGLTPQQITALEINFRGATLIDVDLGGAPLGGLSKGTTIDVFTTVSIKVFKEGEPVPAIVKSRFAKQMAAIRKEEVLDTLLHEAKHYVQHCHGDTTNSWVVKSQEEHDQLPAEKEAIEFAAKTSKEFADKIKIYDATGHFKPEAEIIPKGCVYSGAIDVLDRQMVARFTEDSPENSLAYDYFNTFEGLSQQPTRIEVNKLYEFLAMGRNYVEQRIISAYESNIVASKLAKGLRQVNNPLGAEVAESAIISGAI